MLKTSMTRDLSHSYISGVDIKIIDLEKKIRAELQLLTGRKILDMIKRGMQYYRKVLVFSSHKWDMTKNESKDSGYSIIDVMEYIRLSMYKASLPIYKDKDDDNNDGEI